MVKNNKKALGRGLNSLLGSDTYENDTRYSSSSISKKSDSKNYDFLTGDTTFSIDNNKTKQNVFEVDINNVVANLDQPRKVFKENELKELSQSIKTNGLLQPILVCKKEKNLYEVIAGERRLRASKLANLKKIPIIVRNTSKDKNLELALIENIQRENLNPMEEALCYKQILNNRNLSHTELAKLVSKGRSTITNSLRLLELPENAQKLLLENKITPGHARAILSITENEKKDKLINKIVNEKLTVRESERLANLYNGQRKQVSKEKNLSILKSYKKAASVLTEIIGNKVKIKNINGKNKIEIEFKDEEDLQRIIKVLVK